MWLSPGSTNQSRSAEMLSTNFAMTSGGIFVPSMFALNQRGGSSLRTNRAGRSLPTLRRDPVPHRLASR